VVVLRASNVREMEPTAGKFKSTDRLPQYLIRAMLA